MTLIAVPESRVTDTVGRVDAPHGPRSPLESSVVRPDRGYRREAILDEVQTYTFHDGLVPFGVRPTAEAGAGVGEVAQRNETWRKEVET